jgi:hypothetical protein
MSTRVPGSIASFFVVIGSEERDALRAELIDDRLERLLLAAGHRRKLGQALRATHGAALGVDVGKRPEQVLDDLLALGILGCLRHDLISVVRQQRSKTAGALIILEPKSPGRTAMSASCGPRPARRRDRSRSS